MAFNINDEKKLFMENLECHFKWKPSGKVIIQSMEEKLLSHMDENPLIYVQGYSLLSYIFSSGVNGYAVDFIKAMDYTDKCMAEATCNGDRYVVLANKLHLLLVRRKSKEFEQTFLKLEKLKLDKYDRYRIKLIEAFALAEFGLTKYDLALDKYKEALEICPDSANAYFGIALILGRQRRYKEGYKATPSDEEYQSCKKANELWEEKNPNGIIWYALCIISQLTATNQFDAIEREEKIDYVEELLLQAMNTDFENFESKRKSLVYKWCQRGFKSLCLHTKPTWEQRQRYIEIQRECVDKALEMNPDDSGILHEAGIFYYFDKQFEKAEFYLESACKMSNTNITAEDMLIRLKLKLSKGEFCASDAYAELLDKYLNLNKNSPNQSFYKVECARLYYLLGKELKRQYDPDAAEKEYFNAIILDPTGKWAATAKKCLLEILNEKKTRAEKNKNIVEIFFDIGRVYEITKDFQSAEAAYLQVLDLDQNYNKARAFLCQTLFELKDYQRCVEQGELYVSNLKLTETLPGELKVIIAKSYYYWAERTKDNPNVLPKQGEAHDSLDMAEVIESAAQLLQKSASYNLLEAAMAVSDMCMSEGNGMTLTDIYKQLAPLLNNRQWWLLQSHSAEDLDYHTKVMEENIYEYLMNKNNNIINDLIFNELKKLREIRIDVTIKQHSEQSGTIELLQEARNQLDRAFCTFKEKHFPDVKNKNIKYPLISYCDLNIHGLQTDQNLRKSQEQMEEMLEKPKPKGMVLTRFLSRFPDLFQYLSKHQAIYDKKFAFIPEFVRIVNEHKHAKGHHDADDYGLAQQACDYVEDFALEISKYLKITE